MNFDQRNVAHQDWLLAKLESDGLGGFYETQDIADLLQGSPVSLYRSTVAGYLRRRRDLPQEEFLGRLYDAKVRRGTAAHWDWELVEATARLRGHCTEGGDSPPAPATGHTPSPGPR